MAYKPMLKQIIGRDTDIIYSPKGKALIVHFFTGIFEHYSEIEQFQIVKQKGKILQIRYIPGSNYNESILIN